MKGTDRRLGLPGRARGTYGEQGIPAAASCMRLTWGPIEQHAAAPPEATRKQLWMLQWQLHCRAQEGRHEG